MKKINIKKLKPGDLILAYDAEELKWIRCKVNRIEKGSLFLEDVEGSFKGWEYEETFEAFQDPDYYRLVK